MPKDYTSIISDLRNKVNKISQENARIDGEISAITKKMKKEFGVNSIEEAKSLITRLNGEITEMTNEIESEIYQIKEILDEFDQ